MLPNIGGFPEPAPETGAGRKPLSSKEGSRVTAASEVGGTERREQGSGRLSSFTRGFKTFQISVFEME